MQKLMIDETLDTVEGLQGALIVAESHVSTLPKETPFHGFEERWPFSFMLLFEKLWNSELGSFADFCVKRSGWKSGDLRKGGEIQLRELERRWGRSLRCCRHQIQRSWSWYSAGCQPYSTLSSSLLMATLARLMCLDCPIPEARSIITINHHYCHLSFSYI